MIHSDSFCCIFMFSMYIRIRSYLQTYRTDTWLTICFLISFISYPIYLLVVSCNYQLNLMYDNNCGQHWIIIIEIWRAWQTKYNSKQNWSNRCNKSKHKKKKKEHWNHINISIALPYPTTNWTEIAQLADRQPIKKNC